MGKILGTRYNKPQFQCENGTILDLKPISGLVYDRWQLEYNRKHPTPKPPRGKDLENGNPYYNKEDPDYVQAATLWNDNHQEAMFTFLFGKGVLSNPPDDWVNEFEIYEDNPKLAWLFTILEADGETEDRNELTQLMKAIIGLDMVTEGAVQEAQKN